jgi:hypothetical protein
MLFVLAVIAIAIGQAMGANSFVREMYMLIRTIRVIIIAIVVLAVPGNAANLLPNGGFESGTSSWTFGGSGATRTVITDTNAPSLPNILRFTRNDSNQDDYITQDPVNLQPDRVYRLGYYLCDTDGTLDTAIYHPHESLLLLQGGALCVKKQLL